MSSPSVPCRMHRAPERCTKYRSPCLVWEPPATRGCEFSPLVENDRRYQRRWRSPSIQIELPYRFGVGSVLRFAQSLGEPLFKEVLLVFLRSEEHTSEL